MSEFVDILFKYRNEVCLYNIMFRVCATCLGCVIARRSALPLPTILARIWVAQRGNGSAGAGAGAVSGAFPHLPVSDSVFICVGKS